MSLTNLEVFRIPGGTYDVTNHLKFDNYENKHKYLYSNHLLVEGLYYNINIKIWDGNKFIALMSDFLDIKLKFCTED